MLAKPRGDEIEVYRLAAVREFQLSWGQFAMLLPADRPDPFASINAQSGDTAFRVFFGMGQADELKLRHAPIYILEVVDCQVRPFVLKVFEHEPAMAVNRFGLTAQQNRGNVEDCAI